MTLYNGNAVAYGSGAHWYVQTEVTNTPATTGPTVNVTVTRRVVFSHSISDSVNTGSWTGPDGSGSYNNTSYVSGSGTSFVVDGPKTFAATVIYGGGNSLHFTQTADRIAGGDTGPSSLSINHPLPARLVGVPSAPGTPSASSIGPVSATLSWSAPSQTNGSAVDYYQVQVDDNSGFGSTIISTTDTAPPFYATGLPPATTLYARVRAHNSAGYGPWSGTRTFATLSGAKVRVGGAWVDAVARVRVAGAWVPVKVHKRVSGSWVL